MDKNKNTHGGPRPGAGRPKGIYKKIKEDKEISKSHTISMTDRQWEIFKKNGGSKNLQKYIDSGRFRKLI